MPRFLLSCLAAFCLSASTIWAGTGHAIVISCDGMRPDAIAKLGKEGLPHLYRLMEEGVYTGNARTDFDSTITLPNHTSMITGRAVKGDAGHNWVSNGTPKLGEHLHRKKGVYLNSMFDVAHDHGFRTGLFNSKEKFLLYDRSYDERRGRADAVGEDDGKDKIDVFEFSEDTSALVEIFLTGMTKDPYHLSFIHLRDPDTAGHGHGWNLSDDSPYLQALQHCDTLIGQILALIDREERLKGKTWLIVTADHGGRLKTKTHTDATQPLNYTIPFFVWGPGVATGADLYELNSESRADPGEINPTSEAAGSPPVRNGDSANLALTLLGLPAIEGSTINVKQDLAVLKDQVLAPNEKQGATKP